MVKRRKIVLYMVVLAALAVVSCKNSSVSYNAEEHDEDSVDVESPDSLELFEEVALPNAVDELFDDFFFNFVSDMRFQSKRIAFPVTFVNIDNSSVSISSTDWPNYNSFSQQEFFSVIYDRASDLNLTKDTTITSVGVEWLYLHAGYCERYNFNKNDGKWMLTDVVQKDFDNVPNGEFLHFYSQFVSDSVFQRETLSQELRLNTSEDDEDEYDGGDDESEPLDGELSADDWFDMRQEMPILNDVLVNIDYGQSVGSKRVKNVMLSGMSNGLLITFKFSKIDDLWKLVEIEN